MVAAMLAARHRKVAFAIALASPALSGYETVKEALARAGNEDVTIQVVPGVNHLFREAETADPQVWPTLNQEMPDRVIQVIADWLLARVEVAG